MDEKILAELDGEMLGINLIEYLSINPKMDDWYERCHWVSHKLGFHIDYYPHNENHYINGLNQLYKKLKDWHNSDKKLYWKYLDLVEECINQLNHTTVKFIFKGDDVIIVPR